MFSALEQTGSLTAASDCDGRPAMTRRRAAGCELIGSLAEDFPELRAFTADATLDEIKVLYGLSSFEQVLALGRERVAHRAGTRV